MANDAVPVNVADLYNTLSPGRMAALHAEFQFRYAPNTTKGDRFLQPQLFQQFLQTPQALQTLIGTGYQPGVTPNQAPAQTQTAAQHAQGRELARLAEAKVAQQFGPVQNGLALAQLMARIEPGRITTPQFNMRANTHNFGEFAMGNGFNTPLPAAPTMPTMPTANPNAAFNRPTFPGHRASAQNPFGGPSQEQLVSTVQNGLRLGKGIKGRSY